MASNNPTPYDTGARLEPHPWVDPVSRMVGTETLRPAEDGDYGHVDFDDDEGATRATVWAEKTDGGRYKLHVVDFGGNEEHVIELVGW